VNLSQSNFLVMDSREPHKMSMWGGGVPPPQPPSVEPPARNKRNKVVDTELEALRQKGLAKLLNRHFTSVTKAISEERAAAEEALRDLETRKANTSEFTISKGGYSFYDQRVKDLQQKKAGVKRKEKETLLLYQRYVDKFGGTGTVAVPNTSDFKKSDSKTSRRVKKLGKKALKKADSKEGGSQKDASTGGDKIPSVGSTGLIENNQSKRVSDEHDSSDTNKRKLEKTASVATSDAPLITKDAIDSGSTLQGLEKQTTLPSQSIATDSGAGQKMLEEECLLSDSNVNNLAASLPTLEGETEIPMISKGETIDQDADLLASLEQPALKASASEDLSTNFAYEESEDEKSVVSGLTTSASLALSDAESCLYEFIRTETEAVRQILSEEENSVSTGIVSHQQSVASSFGNESTIAAKKAELMVQQMQDMMDDYKSTAVKSESILGPEKTDFEPYDLRTGNPNENWTALWCDNHKREYYHEKNSGKTQWEKPQIADKDAKWEKAGASKSEDDDFVPMTDYSKKKAHPSNLMTFYESEEAATKRRPKRRDLYRQRQRKLRNRRRIIAVMAFLTICCVTAFYCYTRQQTDLTFPNIFGTAIGKKNAEQINEMASKETENTVPSKKVENVKQTDRLKAKLETEKERREVEHEQPATTRTKDKSDSRREQSDLQEVEEEQKRKVVENKERERQAKEVKAEREQVERQHKAKEEQARISNVQQEKVERQRQVKEEQAQILKVQQEEAEHQRQMEEKQARTAKAQREEAERQRRAVEEKARVAKAKTEEAEQQRREKAEEVRVAKAEKAEQQRREKAEEVRVAKVKTEEAENQRWEKAEEVRVAKAEKAEYQRREKAEKVRVAKAEKAERQRQAEEEIAHVAKAQQEEAERRRKGEKDKVGVLEALQEEFEAQKQATEMRNDKPKTKETPREELERRRKLEDAEWKELERRAKEERARIANALREEAKALAKAKKDSSRKEREEKRQNRHKIESNELAIPRPWHCNLPLFYLLNKTCRQLSTANPIFDLASLIDAMMQ